MRLKKLFSVIFLLLSLCFIVSCDFNFKFNDNSSNDKNDNNDENNDQGSNSAVIYFNLLKSNILDNLNLLLESYDKSLYRNNEWNQIEDLIIAKKDEINAITELSDLEKFDIQKLITLLDEIKTDKELTEIENKAIKDKQNSLINAVKEYQADSYKNLYYDNEWNQIVNIINLEIENINKTNLIDGLNKYSLDSFKEKLSAIKTKKAIDKEKLESEKTNAINKINTIFLSYKQSDYKSDDWNLIVEFINKAKKYIEALNNIDSIKNYDYNSLINNLNSVYTLEDYLLELNEAKEKKINQINACINSYNENDYNEANWTLINKLIEDATKLVSSYDNTNDVNDYDIDSLIDELDKVLTIAEINAIELDSIKEDLNNRLAMIILDYPQANYYDNEFDSIIDLIEKEYLIIDSYTNKEAAGSHDFNVFKNKLNLVKTKAQIIEENLISRKEEVINEIELLASNYKEEDYRLNEWQSIVLLISSAKSLINSYTRIEEVDEYSLDALKNELDLIKTDAELTLEESKVYSDLSFHFLELGNYNAGDSTFIKAGDVDILIDAGSDFDSIPVITEYIDKYCTDGVLEYVIATHAHLDHIAGFAPYNGTDGIFELYECEVIIDFALKNTTSQVSTRYIERRDAEIAKGAKHYTAADCINQTNGGKPVFNITEDITMEILDHKYYHQTSSDENNYSVCTLFTQGENNYLLTGDLEQEGEESLVSKNDLPHCVLYKGGHHGSKTSSNDCLLDEITPEICAVCCCAGTSEYTYNTDNQFPTQEFINRIAKHTDCVYVTSTCEYEIAVSTISTKGVAVGDEYLKSKADKFKSLNGNIVVSTINCIVSVNCSNNNTKLKDSDWFNSEITLNGVTRKMRTWPSYGVGA